MSSLKRFASILLLIAYLSLGSGALGYLHNLQHAAEDAREDKIATASGKPVEAHHHDESNCPFHASLLLAFFFDGWVSLFRLTGLFLAFVILARVSRLDRSPLLRICCRGPPSFRTSQ